MPEAPVVATPDGPAKRLVVIGATAHADCLSGALRAIERDVTHLPAPEEGELVDALLGPVSVVVVLTGDDDLSLRYAIAASRRAPSARLLIGIHDDAVSVRLAEAVPKCVTFADHGSKAGRVGLDPI